VIQTLEVEREDYKANDSNRCYFCKDELYTTMSGLASDEGYAFVANGANVDDLGDFRPGLGAAKRHGVRAPLVEAGLTKDEIRELSHGMGPVTIESLGRIAKAEEFLHGLGIAQLRVRHHGSVARIEVEPSDLALLVQDDVRSAVSEHFRSIGYAYVTLDMEGFRSGSLNETLAKHGKAR
jgi:uncharacterized protein